MGLNVRVQANCVSLWERGGVDSAAEAVAPARTNEEANENEKELQLGEPFSNIQKVKVW